MTIEVTAFRWVPAFAQGYVKDLRVRWALEEAALPYRITLVDAATLRSAQYRRWQPFGQVPAYRDGDVELFESGAIVLHIAATSPLLAPADGPGRARTSAWVFAALNSVEPVAQKFIELANEGVDNLQWQARRGEAADRLRSRLAALSAWLGDRDHLEAEFGAGDLVMTTVLRELVDSGALAPFPRLDEFRRRCETRPAFVRALNAQLQTFRDNAPS